MRSSCALRSRASVVRRAVGLAFALGAGAGACRDAPAPADPPAVVAPRHEPGPEGWPLGRDPEAFSGSAACIPCHAPQHQEWAASPHGRSMGRVADGGWLAPELPQGAELWLGSGRQHQVYVRRDAQGVLRLSPRIWSTLRKRWLPMNLYQRGEPDMAVAGCFNCHLSGVTYAVGERGVAPRWVELPVSCESCHGPAATHVRVRRAGGADGYGATEGLGAKEEATLCGRCHGNRAPFRASGDGPSGRAFHKTLASSYHRVDATQEATAYQLAGHVMSACHQVGSVQCRHCHDPHSGHARALDGRPATGKDSDRQCTVCHRDRIDRKAAERHAKHPAHALRCVDCHMSPSWIGGTPERDQATADHAISVPRLAEATRWRLPNACARCHPDRPGGRLGEERAWVRAVAEGRGASPRAAADLVALLRAPRAGDLGRATALELLAGLPPDPSLVGVLRPWAADSEVVVRTHALIALATHDPRGASAWIRAGLDDPHPVARLSAFARAAPGLLRTEDLERFEVDALAWRQRPRIGDAVHLSARWTERGQFDRALSILERGLRQASPDERRDLLGSGLLERARRLRDGGVSDRPWAQ